jgi:Lon-like ATP-dependent protease
MIEKKYEDKVEIIPVDTLDEVLENILMGCNKKNSLIKKMKKISSAVANKVPDGKINGYSTHNKI